MAEPSLPEHAADCHFHIYEDTARYPVWHPSSLYSAPYAPISALLEKHRSLGIDRGVLVQPHSYGNDFSLLLDFLRQAPTYRGIAMVDDSITDAELAMLDAAGVRGARFHFQSRFGSSVQSMDEFRRSVARMHKLGWIVKVFLNGDDLPTFQDELRKIKSPVLIDHMGRIDLAKGTSQPSFQLLLELLQQENWWILLSNGDVRDKGPTKPWEDAIPFGQMLYEAAPDRCIWGTDWPHITYNCRYDRPPVPVPDDASLVELLSTYLPDAAARKKVMCDNPARLFGFS
jgi:2-pyrone-4,6-dicarboxylate lactonase